MISKFDVNTYYSDRFFPPFSDQTLYFGNNFEPQYNRLYMPEISYKVYGIPALGQADPASVFQNLATVGMNYLNNSENERMLKDKIKADRENARIQADALAAVLAERNRAAQAPIVTQGPNVGLLVLGGTLFLATVGGIMYFLSK